ncbi:Uncharacterised protein [Dermatophilus congolensis]|uniref:Uncharacterized protein n=1 Tax=Dermatophilus congolensis TaxID=1863 RepID=A0AA46GZK9_9MICO|nr:Uncharacterised protein [Dermatophilus congolensis]
MQGCFSAAASCPVGAALCPSFGVGETVWTDAGFDFNVGRFVFADGVSFSDGFVAGAVFVSEEQVDGFDEA